MRPWSLLVLLTLSLGAARAQSFDPTWESLAQYEAPEWFRDAKYGIFMHWGPQSVPGVDGWYGRNMYMQEGALWGDSYNHHVATYGHPSEFGYKDLIPLWTAENWDPDALVRFYKAVGARYVVPVAAHHDNFDLFDSTWQPWNSVNMGPRRDVVGEWRAAADRHGLRFGVSSHSAQAWWWLQTAHGADVSGPRAGVPYDGRLRAADGAGTWWEGYDPRDLYVRPHAPDQLADEAFVEQWYKRHVELLDRYEPDILYFDGELPFGGPGLDLAAYYYNQNQTWHDGALDGVLTLKHLPVNEWGEDAVVLQVEKGHSASLRSRPWQADVPLQGHWFRTDEPVYPDVLVVHTLCDIVAKNGNLMLNVGLNPDGTIPAGQERVLQSVGDWLAVNGEAIFETRPWVTFGEGPTEVGGGAYSGLHEPLTPEDVRFTTRGDTLYAVLFGRPAAGQIAIESLRAGAQADPVLSVELLGYAGAVPWSQSADGLAVSVPADAPDAMAYVLRITGPLGATSAPPPPPAPVFRVRPSPNPFSGTTRLRVEVPTHTSVSARVFDLQGRLVREVRADAAPGGETALDLDLRGLPSGTYFGRVTAGPHTEVVQLVHMSAR